MDDVDLVEFILYYPSYTLTGHGRGSSSVVEHWVTNLWARGSIPGWSMLEGFLIRHRHAFVPACPGQPNWCKGTGHFISLLVIDRYFCLIDPE